ncbi:MAG: hypothetical protein FWD31_00095 [Planctomycetaceae bacterium]|nr:hypothetical protein [Planctomycetaceae bacterium]
MASPFKLFRKNQKTAFALLTIMAMLSFIVFPNLLQYFATSGSVDVTFATSRYGKIDYGMLTKISSESSSLAQFYDRLAGEIMIEHQMRCYRLEVLSSRLRSMSEEQSVEQWFVAQWMREEGYSVSREEVGDFLTQVTYNPSTQQSYVNEEIYRKAADAAGLSDRGITYLVGNQLLLNQFMNLSDLNVKSLTPETEFDWYNRFNRMMKIEAIPVSVSDFTSQVAAPTQKELKKFFEDNKFRDRNPWFRESGFGIPVMVKGEYVYYDTTMFQPDEVTDEEVEQYYEENKERYVESPMTTPSMRGIPTPGGLGTFSFDSALGELTLGETVTPSEDTTTLPEMMLPSDESLVDASSETALPEMSVEPIIPPTDGSATENTTENDSVPSDAEAEFSTEETIGWNGWNVPIRLVSWQTDAEEQGEAATVVHETTEPAAPESETPPTMVTETPMVTLSPPLTPALPSGGGLGLGGGGLGSGLGGTTSPFGRTPLPNFGGGAITPGSANPASVSTPVIYRPLDDGLKAEIRVIIAKQKMDAKLAQVQDVMNEYHREYIKSIQQKNAKLTLPDLAAVARQHGLKYVNLGHIDSYDLIDKNYGFAQSLTENNNEMVPVSQAIFMGRGVVNEKRGYRSMNPKDGIDYLFWITEISEPKIPAYTDSGVAEQVEARWRQVEARSLAQAKAEELAETVRKAEGSFLEFFSANPSKDVKTIVGSEFFSWMDYRYPNETYRYLGYPPEFFVSRIRESGVMPGDVERDNVVLKHINDDFMQAVYHLEPGGIAVTHNEPKDTYFVVRLVEVSPADDAAFDAFAMALPHTRSIFNLAAVEDRKEKVLQGAMKKVFEKTKFQWKVKPSEYQQQERLKSQQNPTNRRQDDRNLPANFPTF